MRIACGVVVTLIAGAAVAGAEAAAVTFKLHPAEGLAAMDGPARSPVPFTQAVPFAEGVVAPDDVGAVAVNGDPIEAATRILNHWPDGSVRMILVEGVLPADRLAGGTLDASFKDEAPSAPRRKPRTVVRCRGLDRAGQGRTWYGIWLFF